MKVKFSDESLLDLRNIEEYLLEHWSDKIFDNFLTKFNETIEIISEGNVIFQKYENTDYHKVLITKHNTLIYTIEDNVLKIIKILQNFQDPDDNYESLKS